MTEFYFLNGNDVTVRIDDELFGGVKSIKCTDSNEKEDIFEVLSSKPIYSVCEPKYSIELEFCVADFDEIERIADFSCLQIADRKKRVTYSECKTDSINTEVLADKKVSCVIKITAEKRNVDDRE